MRNIADVVSPVRAVWIFDYRRWRYNIPATFDAGRAWSYNAEINYAPLANLYEALLDPFYPNQDIESLLHVGKMNFLCVDGHLVPFRPEPDGTSENSPWPNAWPMVQQ
jgi:hypothetical protein